MSEESEVAHNRELDIEYNLSAEVKSLRSHLDQMIKADSDGWMDRHDSLTSKVKEHNPVKNGSYKEYAEALTLVSNRHSKSSLVDLVSYFIQQAQDVETELKQMTVRRDRLAKFASENGADVDSIENTAP